MKPGQFIRLSLFGHYERVRILAVHRAGTIDVQRSGGVVSECQDLAYKPAPALTR
jgi:hypothetical protein